MTVKEVYEAIGGDYKDVLTRLPSDEIVQRFLQKYISSKEFDKMLEAYLTKDYDALFMTSHNLKGMAAGISLNKIQENISKICEAVRHGAPTIDITPLVEEAKKKQSLLIELVNQL